jgi:group I intron endonuclease
MKKYYIYKITNLLTGKAYVGQKYVEGNKNPLKDNYMGSGLYIKRSIEKYGKENFKKEILIDELTSQFAANIFEIYFIKKEETLNPNGYNFAIGGQGGKANKGHKHSEETKNKISKANKGRKHTKETKLKMHHPHKKFSNDTRQKMSIAKKGKCSKETKLKMSLANLGNKKMKGKHHSKETKLKMSLTHKGRKFSEEHKQAIRLVRLGKKHTEETKQKISKTKLKQNDI